MAIACAAVAGGEGRCEWRIRSSELATAYEVSDPKVSACSDGGDSHTPQLKNRAINVTSPLHLMLIKT